MKKWICSLLLLLAGSLPAAAAPNVSFFGRTLSPLLYMTSAESGDFGASFVREQVYIFRDGTVLVAALGDTYQSELPTGGSIISGTASRARMMELTAALANARVGHQTDCRIDPPDSPLEWYFELRWFGAGSRTNRFKATQAHPGPDCPFAVEELISAVQRVINSAFQSKTTDLHTP